MMRLGVLQIVNVVLGAYPSTIGISIVMFCRATYFGYGASNTMAPIISQTIPVMVNLLFGVANPAIRCDFVYSIFVMCFRDDRSNLWMVLAFDISYLRKCTLEISI